MDYKEKFNNHYASSTKIDWNYRRLLNLSIHLTTVHGINGQERKRLLAKARFSVLFSQPEQPLPQSDSTPMQCGYTVPEMT